MIGPACRTAILLFAFALRAQEPQPPVPAEPPTATSLLLRLGERTLTLDEARPIVAALVLRPLPIRMQTFDLLCRRYASSLRALHKARERVRRAVAKEVPKVVRDQLGRSGEAKVEKLREQALAITRMPELTKQRIEHDIDPLLAQLRELVLVTPEQVCKHDEALDGSVRSLRRQLDAVRGWFDLHLAAMHELDTDPEGRAHVDRQHQEPDPPPTSVIDDDLELLCLAALPMSGRDSKALEANEALRGTLDPEEFAGTLELNKIRIALGLPAVLIDEKLGTAARDHSADMHKLGFFAHESPVPGKRSPGDRAARAGTSGSAENIAAGQDTGRGAIRAWWYSPGHHKNMLGGHARTGLGRCEHLWTQMFGG